MNGSTHSRFYVAHRHRQVGWVLVKYFGKSLFYVPMSHITTTERDCGTDKTITSKWIKSPWNLLKTIATTSHCKRLVENAKIRLPGKLIETIPVCMLMI
jgi:hypothetical protein